MGELVTAVKYELSVKIIVLWNNILAEVLFEQRELGNPTYAGELAPIDSVSFAKACAADGFRCGHPREIRTAIQSTLRSPRTENPRTARRCQ
jgi:pyruvate dehydrogenase (quinone)